MHLSRIGISVGVGVTAALWALHVWLFESRPPSWSDLAPFSFVVGGLVLIGLWFEHRLWRTKAINALLNRPDLRGTWRCEMQSNHKDKETGKPIPPIHCFAAVTQSFSELQLHMMTPESQSWLIASDIRKSQRGSGYQAVGVYTNQPGIHARLRSEIHRGTVWLDTHGSDWRPESLTGEYWTDRDTKGSLTLSHRVFKIFSRFDEADAHFSEPIG